MIAPLLESRKEAYQLIRRELACYLWPLDGVDHTTLKNFNRNHDDDRILLRCDGLRRHASAGILLQLR